MKYFLLTSFAFILSIINICAQEGIRLNTQEALPSLTLFQNFDDTYLVDNCGNLVNTWDGIDDCDNHPKLLPNGNLLYIEDNVVYERDWDNTLVKTTRHSEFNLMLDYEVIPLPNGNYLCLARRIEPLSFFSGLGYNLSLSDYEYDDTVVELEAGTGEVVWEWRISDHIIQARSSGLANFGNITDNPQLLDLDAISTFDWDHEESFMINGMDYNAELDQIALSVRKISEVVIIDHSTTTEEASGHEGGKYGMGGDIMYRWGNPQNYHRGSSDSDRILYFQHNPNWIEHGPYKGSIMIYNNGLNRSGSFGDRYSSVDIITPEVNSDGSYSRIEGERFGPESPAFRLDGLSLDFYSGYTSGAKVLPNGNIYVTVGVEEKCIEFDMDGNRLWEYDIIRDSYTFRSVKYPLDYPAFEGRTLMGDGTVESPASFYNCSYFGVSTENVENTLSKVSVTQNSEEILLESKDFNFTCELYNTAGQQTRSNDNLSYTHKINTSMLTPGMYFILIKQKAQSEMIKVIIN